MAEEASAGMQGLNIQDQAPLDGPKPTVILVIGEHARLHSPGLRPQLLFGPVL